MHYNQQGEKQKKGARTNTLVSSDEKRKTNNEKLMDNSEQKEGSENNTAGSKED